jgi:ATP-dependent DNA helicase RecQ
VFHNTHFRPYQREAVNVVLARFNLLCCLPTGGGKSLVYQLPGLVARGTTIVISPLLALIQDQTSQLAKKGISARAITSQVPVNEISAIYRGTSRAIPCH